MGDGGGGVVCVISCFFSLGTCNHPLCLLHSGRFGIVTIKAPPQMERKIQLLFVLLLLVRWRGDVYG